MSEMVLYARTLPEPLLRLIPTEKVKVREINGEVLLTPINEMADDCPLYGMYSDGKITLFFTARIPCYSLEHQCSI